MHHPDTRLPLVRFRLKPAVATAATMIALAALGLPLQPATAAEVTVHIDNFTFSPAELTVAPGTTVTWINTDDIPHTVVAKAQSFRSKALDTEDRFSFTFTSAGDYDYFCSLHPHMVGKVIVKPAG